MSRFQRMLPLVVPAAVGLILAAVTWLTVGVVVHAQAESRRREMRYALVSYLTLVALHRAAGQAMGKSLELAATSSSAWTFQRIAQRMALATRSGSNEWAGLAGLAAELGIDELSDLASIADTAGVAGAGVYSTLMARAQSLRHELQTKEGGRGGGIDPAGHPEGDPDLHHVCVSAVSGPDAVGRLTCPTSVVHQRLRPRIGKGDR